ncbi:MAG TPA: helix-turn-helix transcriptional regulator [Candidatus Omnitrophota bacterium]|nr:helix-turn-helix transcriptional regulator [Candidatus Omnitrophota bacterium]
MQWGANIRRLRAARGWKQVVLAEMLGVDQATVSRWERGLQRPDVTTQMKLRDMLRANLPEIDRVALAAIQQSPHLALAFDRALRLVAVSEAVAARAGRDAADLVGGELCAPMAPDLAWATEQAERAGFWAGEVAAMRLVARAPLAGGAPLHARYVWSPLFLAGGEVVAAVQCREIERAEYLAALRGERLTVIPLHPLAIAS